MSSTEKHDLENGTKQGGAEHHNINRTLTTITLTPQQFEMMYLQPKAAGMQYPLAKTFGNPTPLGVSSFLLALMPLALDLCGFRGASAASSVAMLGGFYAVAGIGLYLACIMEWVIGNTFPSVVFGTFGGFFISYAIINAPNQGIAASFAPASDASNGATAAMAGSQSPSFNVGLGMYFLVWGILVFIYFLASLRTNIPFVLVFLSLTFAFELIAAGYFHAAQGKATAAAMEFKVAGGFAFVTSLAGFYIDIALLLGSVGYPATLPLFDLSTRVLAPKNRGEA